MSTFTQFSAELDLRFDVQSANWQVLTPFTYAVGSLDSGIIVVVEKGFMTDGASVPRPFWNIIPPWGQYGQAAVVHDRMYTDLYVVHNGVRETITHKRADEIFLEAMGVLGVPAWKRYSMFYALRLFGTLIGRK